MVVYKQNSPRIYRKIHNGLFPEIVSTTKDGKREYMKQYMRIHRANQKTQRRKN